MPSAAFPPATTAADPLTAAEFAALMEPLGPFGARRRVAVAVSGGADSTALAWLAAGWGQVSAFIVDHGLRAGSANEAALTRQRLAARGIGADILTLDGVSPGPGLQARARAARYAALVAACRADGLVDLLVGHHRADQQETVTMRRASGSGAAGLAGMAAVTTDGAVAGEVRLLRPLLAVSPLRLRATLRAAGLPWVEDPTNTDPRFARARLRRAAADAAPDPSPGLERQAREAAQGWAGTAVHPAGFVALPAGPIARQTLAAALWTVSGRGFPPSEQATAQVMDGGTLHGARVLVQGGRRFVVREAAAMGRAVDARAGAVWDGRFRVERCEAGGLELGALGDDAAGLRRLSGLPAAVLRCFPALRRSGALWAVPHLAYPSPMVCASVRIAFRPARPLGGLPFVLPRAAAGVNMPKANPMSDHDGSRPGPDGGNRPIRPGTEIA